MPIVDAGPAEGNARVTDDLIAVREAHCLDADEEVDRAAAPSAWDRVGATRHGVRGVMTQLHGAYLAAIEGLWSRPHSSSLALPRRGAHGVASVLGVDA